VRIALFCPSYGGVGGIEGKALELVTAFRHAGHQTTVLARGDGTVSDRQAEVPIIRLPYHQLPRRALHLRRQLRFLAQLPGTVSGLRRAVAKARSDVVLTLAITSYAPYAIGLASVAPVVLSLEGGEPSGRFTANPRVLRWALRRATRVTACARSLAGAARALAPDIAPRLTFIPNGVDPRRFTDAPAYAHPRQYVVAVGRLVPQKGFDVLIEAFARLPPSVDLLIAGEGPERARLEALRERLALGDRVRLLGTMDSPSIASLYRGALLVACPSRWEGLPLVCLEAMASGRAVVASDVDGIPDAVLEDETGLLVPPEDPEALAAGLASLIHDSARRTRLGDHGRQRVCAELTWSSAARSYLSVLSDAVRETTGEPSGRGNRA
jgi:glycogen(starch) synthase